MFAKLVGIGFISEHTSDMRANSLRIRKIENENIYLFRVMILLHFFLERYNDFISFFWNFIVYHSEWISH